MCCCACPAKCALFPCTVGRDAGGNLFRCSPTCSPSTQLISGNSRFAVCILDKTRQVTCCAAMSSVTVRNTLHTISHSCKGAANFPVASFMAGLVQLQCFSMLTNEMCTRTVQRHATILLLLSMRTLMKYKIYCSSSYLRRLSRTQLSTQ